MVLKRVKIVFVVGCVKMFSMLVVVVVVFELKEGAFDGPHNLI